jgi:hypothetical protein
MIEKLMHFPLGFDVFGMQLLPLIQRAVLNKKLFSG